MNKWIGALLCSSLLWTSCDKDESKTCSYYNKPIPTQVAVVGFYDYEISNIVLTQYDKYSNFNTILRSDTIRMSTLPIVTRDTSSFLFELTNKSDYEVYFPNIDETYRIDKIAYEPEYFDVVEPSGVCNQTISYQQTADSLRMNNAYYSIQSIQNQEARFYLKRQ